MKIHLLTEGQIAVRLDYRDLPDLDTLMLNIWQEHDDETGYRYGDPTEGDDEPTRFAAQSEPDWQWVKISPCHCGEHGWHWDARSAEHWPRAGLGVAADLPTRQGEPDLIADRPKGKFIAIEWSR